MNPLLEPTRSERGPVGYRPRRKTGLETPMIGRFTAEGSRLIFSPPRWYDLLVVVTLGGGLLGLVWGVSRMDAYTTCVAAMVTLAGWWAFLSNERMACDLRRRTFARYEGQGFRLTKVTGSLDELDALVLIAELRVGLEARRTVLYHLVLHWKGARHPLLVLGTSGHEWHDGYPFQFAAGPSLALGQQYAAALGVRFFDNSYFLSPCPVPFV